VATPRPVAPRPVAPSARPPVTPPVAAPPAPIPPTVAKPAIASPLPAARPFADLDYFVPRITIARPPAPARRRKRPLFIGAALVVVLGAGAYLTYTWRAGDTSPRASIAAPLRDATSVQAEASQRTAIMTVIGSDAAGQAGASEGVTFEQLRAQNPNLQWVGATADSTGPNVVSVASAPGITTTAVAAGNGTCAFSRWLPPGAPHYVTLTGVANCRAADAPVDGWRDESPGAQFDMPDPS
jgi:hypothetical protein